MTAKKITDDASDENRGWKRVKLFVLAAGILMCMQSALSMYTKSVLTSVERQFQIPSSLSGLIVGSFNLGNVLFVVLISKLCSEGSRPRSMAIGSLVVAIGGFINTIPHLLSPLYDPKNLTNISSSDWSADDEECKSSNSYKLLFVGETVQGIGAAALVPLASSYVDDYAKPGRSPLCIGIMLFLQNMGPGVGFLIGSLTTRLYVDFDRVDLDEITLRQENKDWVGAWWLGYIVLGTFVIISAIPLFWFPSNLNKQTDSTKMKDCNEINSERHKDNNGHNAGDSLHRTRHGDRKYYLSKRHFENLSYFLKSTFITVQRLLCDPLYLCVVMGYSALMFTVGALTTFMPKFLEIVFYQSKSSASFIFGMSMPLVICLGLVSGGLIVQKAKLETRGKMIFTCVISAVTIVLCTFAYFVTCDPVTSIDCVINGSTNATPCHVQLEEACSSKCYLFVAIVSLAASLACHLITPYYSVILSSVKLQDKSTAIGLKFLVIRVLALIPSPIITGSIIDKACVTWSVPDDCIGSSVCLQHDKDEFRYSFLHIIFAGVIFTFIFNLFGCLVSRRKTPSTTEVNSCNQLA